MTKYNLGQVVRIAIMSIIIAIMLSILIRFKANGQDIYDCSTITSSDQERVFTTTSAFEIFPERVKYLDSDTQETYWYEISNPIVKKDDEGNVVSTSWTASTEDGIFDFVVEGATIRLLFTDMSFTYGCELL